jgi:phage-related baseplate assembly protein
MARLTLDELTQPLSREEVQASVYRVLARLGVHTASWKPGAVVRTIIVGASSVFAAYTELMALIARSGFLSLSAGDWLTLVAWHVYGIERRAATFATGTLKLVNTGGGLYILEPGDLIARNAVTGATYRNTAALTISANSTHYTGIAAIEGGAIGNAPAHAINALVTTLLGVACDNEAALTAADAEPDAVLRQRCSEMLGALSPMGPWDAYSSALRNATDPNGRNLDITRVSLIPDGYGQIDLYCATSTGTLPPSDVQYASAAIQLNAVPQAVTAIVHPAVERIVPVGAIVYAYNTSGMTAAAFKSKLERAARDFVIAQPVGGNVITPPNGYVYLDGIQAALAAVAPEVFHVGMATPNADVQLQPTEVATPGAINVFLQLMPPPEAYHP